MRLLAHRSLLASITTVIYGLIANGAAATPSDTCNLAPSPWLSAYSVYAGGDVDYVCSDFEGTFASGGTARFSRMGLATRVSTSMASVAAHGGFSLIDGSAIGHVEAGGDAFLHHYSVGSVSAGGRAGCYEGSDLGCWSEVLPTTRFDLLASELAAYASSVAALQSQALVESNGALVLQAAPGLNVVTVDSHALRDLGLTIQGTNASTVVVKVTSNSLYANLAHLGDKLALAGGIDAAHVLFAFLDVEVLELGKLVVPGSVLAPRADVIAYEGRIDGALWIGGKLTGNPFALSLEQRIDACPAGASGIQVNFVPFSPDCSQGSSAAQQ